jgi:hypothetical protein
MFTSCLVIRQGNLRNNSCEIAISAVLKQIIYVIHCLRLLNEIIICQAAPEASAPNRLVILEHNNDTVLSFATSDAAADAKNAILTCQFLSLSLSEDNQSSPRWRQLYATKSFLLQVSFVICWSSASV